MWVGFTFGEQAFALQPAGAMAAPAHEATGPSRAGGPQGLPARHASAREPRRWRACPLQARGDERLLQRLRACPPALLRRLIDGSAGWALHRLSDAQVVEAAAEQVCRGALVLFEAERPRQDAPAAGQAPVHAAATGPRFTPAMLRPAPAAAAAEPEAVVVDLLAHIDQARQAAVLRAASQQGVPFCAECERRRQAA
ncbi:MAG: hypothetical protein HY855_05445 [Burkholderiales bacterium]|nr:hypothetical protein [Burkholderiales bacterium]